jgi:spoIIIJ-associated protein
LLKKIIRKRYGEDEEKFSFTLDINDYRMKRLGDLKQDVKDAAKQVRLYGKHVPLRPMSSFERRIVHLLLAEYPDIATESVGQEPDRWVVIKPYP